MKNIQCEHSKPKDAEATKEEEKESKERPEL